MVLSVHISSLGFVSEPVVALLGSGLQCDKIHLLWNDNDAVIECKKKVEIAFKNAGYDGTQLIFHEVNPFDYQSVVKTVMKIFSEEKENTFNHVRFFTNITLGTSIMTAALCTASFMVGAQMYYKLDSRKYSEHLPADQEFIQIPTPKIPDIEKMTTKRRDFLKYVNLKQPVGLTELLDFGSKQNVNQLVNYFVKSNLMIREHNGKTVSIRTTDLGTMVSQWIL